jgi:hypothetical protein
VTDKRKDEPKDATRTRHEVKRVVHFFGLLIVALAGLNLLFYWESGSKFALGVAGVALVGFAAWFAYARRVLKDL